MCRQAYPNLEEVFFDLAGQLNAEPIILQTQAPGSGEKVAITLSGSRLIQVVFNQLYNTGALLKLPAMIYDLKDGDSQAFIETFWQSAPSAGIFNVGMSLSVQCHEYYPNLKHQIPGRLSLSLQQPGAHTTPGILKT